MKKLLLSIAVVLAASASALAQTKTIADSTSPQVETIVVIRHGEKPQGGLGQLNCKGLNRSLALPKVLLNKFGKPQFIFAPNPSEKVDDAKYFYVRPLATIEPTAIYCGLPVNTEFGYLEIEALENELYKPEYRNSTIFIAWEHGLLNAFVHRIIRHNGGNDKSVPSWSNDEYDRIFVFKIIRENGQRKFSYTIDHEGLNGVSDQCLL
ncbi:hypothetical protein A9P82_14850 [Arachidicoccus ginsenosidimutans]|uniref:hypothetical protein n=1 Tax=Arachidicoccus sp. BS20 TaxID=1850526 RepID=UPI0007F0A8CA|nr:hypothetical protein [Arachidicoccus sp. BS20]ANI90451.1 hypothetical protein A9P82_14850 [Arachidicoccus sp. BS20]